MYYWQKNTIATIASILSTSILLDARPMLAATEPAPISQQAASVLPIAIDQQIYFATTRKWDGRAYTSDRGREDRHEVGVCQYRFSAKATRWDMRDYFGRMRSIGWAEAPPNAKDGPVQLHRFDSFEQMLDEIDRVLKSSQQQEITVGVHGYFNSFDDAMAFGADLESYFKSPVISYSWPTPKKFLPGLDTYHVAEGDVAWSQEAFTEFLKALAKRFPGKVNLVCHSMGSRLVANALLDLLKEGFPPETFNEVVFASADFDSKTFANRYARALSLAKKTRFYISPDDKALKGSTFIYGGQPRVGRPKDDVNLLTNLPKTDVIDFSEFGGGFTGHGVALWLISNMHKYGRPGGRWLIIQPSLKLVKKER